jgi:hypothetical protein
MKMRKLATVAIVFAALTATPASAQSFVGQWLATAHTPQGDVSEQLKVTKTSVGYEISVEAIHVEPGAPQAGPPKEITVTDDSFSFTRALGDTAVITYTGRIEGKTFTGKVDIGGYSVPYTGVRTSGE